MPRSGRKETELGSLILKRANNSRLSGRWSDDDYDVLENGVVVGRIFKVPVPPQDRPWMWTSGHNGDMRRAAHGYEPGARSHALQFRSPPLLPERLRHPQCRCSLTETSSPAKWSMLRFSF